MSTPTAPRLIFNEAETLLTEKDDAMSYDPGAVPRSQSCPEHGDVCKQLGQLAAQSDMHEKRGDRIERAIDEIRGNVSDISAKLSNGGIKAKPVLSAKELTILCLILVVAAQGGNLISVLAKLVSK